MKILVGTDGSENATTAMRWAAEEAALHGADLEVLLVWSYLDQHHADRSETFDSGYTEDSAREALSARVAGALGAGAEVTQRVVLDTPASGLLDAADTADLLVLGARGTGGFEGLLLGSVSERVAQNAARPVGVVREAAPVRGGRVVVGVDGSAPSMAALHWAAREATARDADLDVVHAWRVPSLATGPMMAAVPVLSAMEDVGHNVVDLALDGPDLEGVRVRRHLTSESPSRALVELAAGAGLVVVGTRGRGRVASALLGSVSRQVLQHAACPVVVI